MPSRLVKSKEESKVYSQEDYHALDIYYLFCYHYLFSNNHSFSTPGIFEG